MKKLVTTENIPYLIEDDVLVNSIGEKFRVVSIAPTGIVLCNVSGSVVKFKSFPLEDLVDSEWFLEEKSLVEAYRDNGVR